MPSRCEHAKIECSSNESKSSGVVEANDIDMSVRVVVVGFIYSAPKDAEGKNTAALWTTDTVLLVHTEL